MTRSMARIEPLRSCPSGRYDDDLVAVLRGGPARLVVTQRRDGRLHIVHGIRPSDLDDDLAEELMAALTPLTDDNAMFISAFTGIVLTSHPYAPVAWERFYRNNMARLATRPGYGEIYRHALTLLPDSDVLDLGCGFGFLALHLAARGGQVIAADIDRGTTELLRHVAQRLGLILPVLTSDGARTALPDGAVDAVAVLHVLEHLGAESADAVVREALRLARRRVVVAVPYETEPTSLYGHVRSLTPDDLIALGSASRWRYDVHEHHGGWLVLDR